MAQTKYWIQAFRLRTLPLSFSTILMGSLAAYYAHTFQWDVFFWALTTTLFLQILSNLANDYGDAVSGADANRKGPQRMVQSGHISASEMRKMMIAFAVLSFISGLMLLHVALPGNLIWIALVFLMIGVAAIYAAINYTVGKNPYGYKGWGDFFSFVFFGLVGVYGSFFLHARIMNYWVFLPAIAIGMLSAGVLNVNNLRDEESDREAGKRSLIVMKGHAWGVRYHFGLILGAWVVLCIYMGVVSKQFSDWLFVLSFPVYLMHLRRINDATSHNQIDPELKRLSLATFATVMLIAVSIIFR
jgi:1,4-dihydroxy-2-naphthoate octaprenyltransferase